MGKILKLRVFIYLAHISVHCDYLGALRANILDLKEIFDTAFFSYI